MNATVETSIALPAALFEQADALARRLELPRSRLFELAIEEFVKQSQEQPAPAKREPPIVSQGDVFWIRPGGQNAELGYYPHPYVVIQDDTLNRSRIETVVVCALTTNLKHAGAYGNVLLAPGEANLPKQSMVDVSKVSAVGRSQLGEYIGALSQQRVQQILAGMRFLQTAFFAR